MSSCETAADPSDRASGHWKDSGDGADRQGMSGGACQLYDDASHTAECDWTAEARREKLRGNEADSDGIYDE